MRPCLLGGPHHALPERPRADRAHDHRIAKAGQEGVGARHPGTVGNECRQCLRALPARGTGAGIEHPNAVFARARIDDTPDAPQCAAAHQRRHLAKQRGAVRNAARFGMAQQLLERERILELVPYQAHQRRRNRWKARFRRTDLAD